MTPVQCALHTLEKRTKSLDGFISATLRLYGGMSSPENMQIKGHILVKHSRIQRDRQKPVEGGELEKVGLNKLETEQSVQPEDPVLDISSR